MTTATLSPAARFDNAQVQVRPAARAAARTGGSKPLAASSYPWMTPAIERNIGARAQRMMRVGY